MYRLNNCANIKISIYLSILFIYPFIYVHVGIICIYISYVYMHIIGTVTIKK